MSLTLALELVERHEHIHRVGSRLRWHGLGQDHTAQRLIQLLPEDERIVAIEDTLELWIERENCVRFEARSLAKGGVAIREQVRHALRHRNIVVGEVCGGEPPICARPSTPATGVR